MPPRTEGISGLPLIEQHGGPAVADGQLGTVLYLPGAGFRKPMNKSSAGFIKPRMFSRKIPPSNRFIQVSSFFQTIARRFSTSEKELFESGLNQSHNVNNILYYGEFWNNSKKFTGLNMDFKDYWNLDTAMQILQNKTVDSKLWAEAVEWRFASMGPLKLSACC